MNALLTEYDEEQVLMDIGRERYEDGRKDGQVEGRADGETLKLIQLVCKKLRKGQGCKAIAEALEEDELSIQHIIDAARRHAPEYDEEAIYQEL